MKLILFEKSLAAARPELFKNAEYAKGDVWKRTLNRKQDCVLLLPGDDSGILLARLHWVAKQSEAVEAPAGFLGLDGEPVYLDEVGPRSWWQRLFRS